MIDPNIIGQIGFGLSFPVTKGRSDVRGIRGVQVSFEVLIKCTRAS